jgi:hypothetical protein
MTQIKERLSSSYFNGFSVQSWLVAEFFQQNNLAYYIVGEQLVQDGGWKSTS